MTRGNPGTAAGPGRDGDEPGPAGAGRMLAVAATPAWSEPSQPGAGAV